MKIVAVLALLLAALQPLRAQSFTWQDISGVPGFFTLQKGNGDTLLGAIQGFPNENARIYRSADGGRTWQQLSLTNGVLVELVARGPWTVAARFVNISSPFGTTYQIYLSTNNGATWTRVLQSAFQASVASMMISDSGAFYGVVLTGSTKGMIAKWRGSSVWSPFGTPAFPSRFNSTVGAMIGSRTFLVGTDAYGIAITSDSGATWIQALGTRQITAINVDVPGSYYVGASPTNTVTGGVFFSADEGATWRYLGLSDRIITSIAVDGSGRLLASTDAGIFAYTGHLLDWTLTSPFPEFIDRVLIPGPESIIATSAGRGIYRSENNGATWEQNGLRGQDISAILAGEGSVLYLGTYGSRAFVSNDDGASWGQVASNALCDYVFSFARSGSDAYACTDCGLFRSTDTGATWTNLSASAISGGIFSAAITSVGDIYAAANFGVYRSTDQGTTWLPTGLASYPVVGLASGPAGDLLAATTAQGVFRSLDGGVTWTDVGLGRNDVQTVAINWEGHYFVAVNSGVYESTDQGGSWVLRALPDGLVYSIAFGGEYGVAGTSAGVYVSYDRGTTWQSRNTGLLQTTVLSVGVSSGGNLLAGTYHGGIYRTSEIITAAGNEGPLVPSRTQLLQNYPNPFNPTTAIRYQIAAAGEVSLKIYDLLGREVATLAAGSRQPGEYEVTWDAAALPSGVYFSAFRSGSVQQVRKLLLMK
jgi:hypothetical protein